MRKLSLHILGIILLQFICIKVTAQKRGSYDAINSGIPWMDNNGNTVSAHGGNIIRDKGKFYFFGEAHTDTSNAFAGFNCYSSADLYHWKFERIALPVQPSGKLGPNRVGERAKVMKNYQTGEYVMYMHVDTLGYKDQFIGYATAKVITGPYTFSGPLLFNGKPIKKWDMGVFQDKDYEGYILVHGGEIYQLGKDYKHIVGQTNKTLTTGFESPTLFRKNNTYYFLGSNLTSWEKNDNYYYTANSLTGPWTYQGLVAPKDKLTWNSQTTFVLPVEGSKDTTYLFMGDRWSFPMQASAATYVWQPLQVDGNKLAIAQYQPAWSLNVTTGAIAAKNGGSNVILPTDKRIIYTGNWQDAVNNPEEHGRRTDSKQAAFSFTFNGRRVGIYSYTGQDKGYAKVILANAKGKTIYTSIVDLYSKVPGSALVYLTPWLAKGKYTLTVTNTGKRPNWSDKRKANYGSTGNFIAVEKIITD